MFDRYGEEAYTKGFQVYTTVDSRLQIAANDALRDGLFAYDKRYGYREPDDNLLIFEDDPDTSNWITLLRKIPTIHNLIPAAVINIEYQSVTALLKTGEIIDIPWEGLSWAKPQINGSETAGSKRKGPAPKKAEDILDEGDVIRVVENEDGTWRLAQLPEVEGAIVAMDPQNGQILSLTGGLSYSRSMYNRATQAYRQPGSVFKPFVFTAALAKGMTLATIINDAPVVIEDTGIDELWRPQNYTQKFYGPTRLRVGLTQSRNMVSIRLLELNCVW